MKLTGYRIKYLLATAIILVLTVPDAKSQFTYIGGGFSYSNTNFSGNWGINTTAHRVGSFDMHGMIRPLRNVGLGAGVSVPVFQNTVFSFANALTPDGSSFNGWPARFSDSEIYYEPQEIDYYFEQSITVSVNARAFFETVLNSYLDFQVSFFQLRETFNLSRIGRPPVSDGHGDYLYGLVSEEYIDYEQTRNMVVPGIRIGMMPHLMPNLYINANVGVDFLSFNDEGFGFPITHDWDYINQRAEFVVLGSQAEGTKTRWSANLGLGYYF